MSEELFEEREKKHRIEEYNNKNIEKNYGSIEDGTVEELDARAAEIKSRMIRDNNKNIEKNYGSIEDRTVEELDARAAEIKKIIADSNSKNNESFSIEHASDSTLAAMAANKAARAEEHRPSKEYLMSLIDNPDIQNYDEFSSAVSGSMQLNKIMVDFTDGLCEKINSKTFELRNTDKNDRDNVEKIKQEIEKLVSVYERYMYELKDNQWDFSNLGSMKLSEFTTDQLRQEQKRLDIQFDMPIPADLGEYYGAKFERNGKMFPGIDFMYEELGGKEQNWYSVLNYKPDELTPAQRYRQRKLEEIRAKQEVYESKKSELGELQRESQQRGTEYGE